MAEIARKTKRYPSDLTDEEWERITPLLPKPPKRGRKTGGGFARDPQCDPLHGAQRRWLADAADTSFGPWQTVYWWFRRFVRRLLFRTIHDVALMIDRERAGREASPCGGGDRQPDGQGAVAPKSAGYDAGKKIVGRKRHIAVDTDGRLLMVNLTTADISDSAGAQADPGRDPQTLAMAQASVRRRRL